MPLLELSPHIEEFEKQGAKNIYHDFEPHFSPKGHKFFADYLWQKTQNYLKDNTGSHE